MKLYARHSPALFLDRDGVINEDTGYVSKIEDFAFRDGIFEVCAAARASGYMLVVVTNQSGVARGMYSEADVFVLHEWMRRQFEEQGARLSAIYVCPHHPTEGRGIYRTSCECRKPKPGLFLQAERDLAIDLSASVMVGDKPSDVIAATAAGVGLSILLDGSPADATSGAIVCSSLKDVPGFLARSRRPDRSRR